MRENLLRLRAALDAAGLAHDVYYALKANRYPPLLDILRAQGGCGIDACSPAEVRLALEHGFRENEISFTGHAVSEADLEILAAHPDVHVNCDALSTIRRLGRRCPGRRIGIRLNPGLGAGYNDRLRYAGAKPTKFGVYPDRFEEAVATAARCRYDDRHAAFPRRQRLPGRCARRARPGPAGARRGSSTRTRRSDA